MNFPERHGNRWTKEEENRLLQELEDNISIEQVSNNHKRSVKGIKARIRMFVREFYQAGMDIEDIVRKTRLSEEDVFDAMKKDNKVKIDKLHEINDKLEKILKILQNLELV
jgi:hypothetical protein